MRWEASMSFKVMMVFGTRPEAIKMAPLARVLRNWPGIELNICSTGQHREMLKQVLDSFELTAITNRPPGGIRPPTRRWRCLMITGAWC
jgi:UDP-N-acetylglucosamine 2-epimerase